MPSFGLGSRPRSSSQPRQHHSFLPLSLPFLPQLHLQRPRTRLTTLIVFFVLSSPFLIVTYLFLSSPSSPQLLIDPSLNPLNFRLWPPGDPRARPYPQTPEGGQQAQDDYDNKWTSLMDTWDVDDDRLKQSSNAPSVWSAECRAAAAERARRGLPHWHKTGPLVFIGIFTSAEAVAKRSIIRTLFRDQLPIPRGEEDGVKVEVVFVSAQPGNDDWKYLLEEESREYGDVIFVEGKENIDEGKTYEFLRWVEKERGAEQRRPRFVMKTDDDTYLVLPNLIRSLHSMDPCDALYWGTSQGVFAGYPPYFRGLGYALSWPLVKWLATSNLTPPMSEGTEDAKIGRFLQHLPESAVTRVDLGWKMGDWDQLTIDGETVAMHWLKRDEWVPMVERSLMIGGGGGDAIM